MTFVNLVIRLKIDFLKESLPLHKIAHKVLLQFVIVSRTDKDTQ